MTQDFISIKGARQHNLKNINIDIPRDKLVVLTGLSGSGKSSLAFDTIYAEGQRRYVESLSAYARQFLGQMDKPDVDNIDGLSPAISIDQKTTSRNPRSTVGTVTEIHDYLRLLFARIGIPHCPKCGKVIEQQSIDQMVDVLAAYPEGARMQVLAPLIRGRKGEYVKLFGRIKADGYLRVRVDGEIYELDNDIPLDKNKKHTIEVVVDRIVNRPDNLKRLSDSMELALGMAEGRVSVLVGEELLSFNQNFACPDCNISLEEITPRMFSFNNPYGACPTCSGLGQLMDVDPDRLIVDENKSLAQGGLANWGEQYNSWYYRHISAVAEKYGFDLRTPIKDLPKEAMDKVFYGTGKETVEVEYESQFGGKRTYTSPWEGIVNNFQRRYKETNSPAIRHEIETFMKVSPCPACHGARLRPETLGVTIAGKNIDQVSHLTIGEARAFFDGLQLTEREALIAKQILKEIRERLEFLDKVGLDYLDLARAAGTLSGGEAQRIRLATQIGSHLMGVLYILDEPSIGLHQRDNCHLIDTLKHLRDLGNTVLVVEHDTDTMKAADYLIDIGPGAGIHGGEVVAAGTPEEVAANPHSVTGQYLSGAKVIEVPAARRQPDGRWLTVEGACANNLHNIDVSIPLGTFTCVTGVSGSGKSTLVNDILNTALAHELNGAHTKAEGYTAIKGMDQLEKVIAIDQSPIGRTPRSNPATYTGVFNLIRDLYAQTPDAKAKGYKSGRFSFNVKGGRCESCQGDGIIKIEMHFLPDVYVPCEVCKGKRYNRETLDITYKGKNIADVLDMTVDEAADFFSNLPRIYNKIKVLQDVGLGYVHLGQQATTLSGGEAQRVKLATELSRRSDGKTFYILDEPTTGLHTADIQKLLDVLNRLVEAGDTVLVIEHNMDVIKSADYIIDLGPEGGNRGGTVVATGTPEEIAACEQSYTGRFLKEYLV